MNDNSTLPWHPFVWDVNSDGSFTVTDLGQWLQHMFFLPGDWLLWVTLRYAPEIARFFEVSSRDYGSTISALLSVFVWLGIIVTIMTTSHYLAAADRAFTAGLRAILAGVAAQLRSVKRMLSGLLRSLTRLVASRGVSRDMPKLNTEELRVLKAHAYVEPSSSLALSDLVRATGVPRTQIVDILDHLREMHLIDQRNDAPNAEPGYRLTDPGRDLLSATRF